MWDFFSTVQSSFLVRIGIREWKDSVALSGVAWILLLGWYIEFSMWLKFSDFTVNAVEEGRHLCWPFFQSCGEWYFLTQYPYANTQGLVYGILYGILLIAAYFTYQKRYERAYWFFLLLFAWEILVLLLSMRLSTTYWFFHFFYAAVFLFTRHKLFFLRLMAVALYVASGVIKLTDSWLYGRYFTSLAEKLYFIPDSLISLATNAVIVLELVLVWLLLSHRREVRVPVVILLTIFHLYSIIYVGYIYPTVAYPIVLVIFLSSEGWHRPWRTDIKDVAGVSIVAFVVVFNMLPLLITGQKRLTLEGDKYGAYMFEANYQCRTSAVFIYDDREVPETSVTTGPNQRCDPYADFFYFKHRCTHDEGLRAIKWTFDESVNGSKFYRLVDVDNACQLEYRPFSHNPWIAIPGQGAQVVAPAPAPNRYLLSDS